MDFSLNEQQRAIADLARDVFADYTGAERLAQHEADGAPWLAPLYRELAGTGLIGLLVAEQRGGAGQGWLECALALEQQGRALAPVPLWSSALAARAIAEFGDDAFAAAALPALLQGDACAAVLLPRVGLPAESIRAERRGEELHLNGTVRGVVLGAQADWLLLPIALDGGTRLALVANRSAGLGADDGRFTDRQPAATLYFDNVAIAQRQLLAPAADAAWLIDRASLCLAALQLGVVGEALAQTSAYISERRQFDRPIGSFQGVALRAADGFIDMENLRLQVWQLAWRLDANLPAGGAAACAKWWACEAGHRVSHTAQHLHGGMGADITYPIHRYFLWSRALEMQLGGAGSQLARLGDWLAGESDAGVLL